MANYGDESVISYGSKTNPKRKPTPPVADKVTQKGLLDADQDRRELNEINKDEWEL